MNSCLAFNNRDPKFFNSLNSLPRFQTPFVFTNSPNNSSPIQIPRLNTFMPLTPLTGPGSSPSSRSRTPSINSISPLSGLSPIIRPQPTVNPELSNLLMTLKAQQNMQTQMFKSQMDQIMEIKNSLLEKLNEHQAQSELRQQTSVQEQFPNQNQKITSNSVKIEAQVKEPAQSVHRATQSYLQKPLKAQVMDIVHFVLENFGRIDESRFDEEKTKYSYNKDLITVFELLTEKYASTIKTKEEMVKYTLRRAFKFIKNNLKKQVNTNSKGVCKTMCNKYFKASEDEISKVGTEEEFLKVVLPFRKNSKNKTMNNSFISEVFASEEFCRDYESYLKSFDAILEKDNKSKIDRLATFLEDCIKKNKIEEIRAYKRIPWPRLWIQNTKNIAQNLTNIGNQGLQSPSNSAKKLKPDNDTSGDNECHSDISTDSNSNY